MDMDSTDYTEGTTILVGRRIELWIHCAILIVEWLRFTVLPEQYFLHSFQYYL